MRQGENNTRKIALKVVTSDYETSVTCLLTKQVIMCPGWRRICGTFKGEGRRSE